MRYRQNLTFNSLINKTLGGFGGRVYIDVIYVGLYAVMCYLTLLFEMEDVKKAHGGGKWREMKKERNLGKKQV